MIKGPLHFSRSKIRLKKIVSVKLFPTRIMSWMNEKPKGFNICGVTVHILLI